MFHTNRTPMLSFLLPLYAVRKAWWFASALLPAEKIIKMIQWYSIYFVGHGLHIQLYSNISQKLSHSSPALGLWLQFLSPARILSHPVPFCTIPGVPFSCPAVSDFSWCHFSGDSRAKLPRTTSRWCVQSCGTCPMGSDITRFGKVLSQKRTSTLFAIH